MRHVGKLYNLVASWIALSVARDLEGVAYAACVIAAQIGRAELDRLPVLREDLLSGRAPVH